MIRVLTTNGRRTPSFYVVLRRFCRRRTDGDDSLGRELNLDEMSVAGVEPTTFRTARPKSRKTNAVINSATEVYIT